MIKLIADRRMRYNTRRLLPGDDFIAKDKHAKALKLLGKAHDAPDQVASPPPRLAKRIAQATAAPASPATDDPKAEVRALREELKALTGKNVFTGWDADTLKAKIAEARG